ncbi:MAG: NIL domain-containing protein, partial [Candidatus Omnitrophica bacterium]|nr:NIL domain-containing protein [Candidatus Omnitrophota bacterium]
REVELNIPLEYKSEPFICYIIKNFDLTVRIIEASFSTEIGWAIVSFEGKEKEMNRLFDFLKEKDIEITFK